MRNDDTPYNSDMLQLRAIEFGERFEPYTRLVAISVAGVLIYLYTGWISALVWSVYFLVSFGAYFLFIYLRQTSIEHKEIIIAGLLLANMQIAFIWLPTLLVVSLEPPLMLVGGCLICAQMLFLVRRSDTLDFFSISHSLVVIGMSIIVYVSFIPVFDTPLAYGGAALALVGLNYYFIQTMRISRRIRESREQSARQAHQAQKMAAIGQLAGGVAHDFNNNLTAIIGSLELIQLTDDPVEQQQNVENGLLAARQAATTVKHLMIFARKDRPDIREVKVQDVFEELETLTRRLIPTSVTSEMSSADPELSVRVDRHQLLTGLINLIVNSVDAMPQGGSLILRSNVVNFMMAQPLADGALLDAGAYAQITVSDTGHGIAPDILSKVLDPFFTTKPVGKGTGLGLSMVAGMMQEFGGGLSIHTSNLGTQVKLYLPLVQARDAAESVAPLGARRAQTGSPLQN